MKKMYPITKPYRTGYLNVGDGYEIYYECVGKEKAAPIVYLHGGPGAGFDNTDKKLFNKNHNVIFFDQRGSGKSRPFASLKNNNTKKLVDDITKLLDHLGIKKAFFVGGSWGSTLAALYAMKHPERVKGILIFSVFLPSWEDNNYCYNGGTGWFFPEAWEKYVRAVPEKHRNNTLSFYVKKITSKNAAIRNRFAKEFTKYEVMISSMKMTEEKAEKIIGNWYKSMGVLEVYYLKNNFFMPDNYVMKNAKKISVPALIIHGRYDVLCRPFLAYRFHKEIKNSKLIFILSGHYEHAMFSRVRKEIKRFCR